MTRISWSILTELGSEWSCNRVQGGEEIIRNSHVQGAQVTLCSPTNSNYLEATISLIQPVFLLKVCFTVSCKCHCVLSHGQEIPPSKKNPVRNTDISFWDTFNSILSVCIYYNGFSRASLDYLVLTRIIIKCKKVTNSALIIHIV